VRNRFALPLLLGASFALYGNSLAGGFVFDDLTTFRKDRIRGLSFLDLVHDYRPLRYLSLRIDETFFGDHPSGYHVVNTILHGITSFAVFVVLRRLAGPVAALAGALLFVAHPVHTECVAYISGRRDILTTLFFLLGFLAWMTFCRTSRRPWLLAYLALYGLALSAKEMAVTLPVVCGLHDVLLDPAGFRRRLRVHVGMGVLAAAAAVYVALSRAARQEHWHGGSMGANYAISARLVVHYAMLLVFPLRLLGDYSYEAFPLSRSFLEARALLSAAAVAAGVGAAYGLRRRAPRVVFGIGWFLVTLLPVLQIKPFHEIAAEHYLYLPSVGFCLLAGLGFDRLRARVGPRLAWIPLGVVLALFAVRTVVRNADWRDSETFWHKTLETAPRCARAHFNVGMVHAQRTEWSEAAASIRRALAIRPEYLLARYQLGRIYGFLGRPDDAREQFEEALRLAKTAESPSVDPGALCVHLDRLHEAIAFYERRLAKGDHTRTALRALLGCQRALGVKAGRAGRVDEAQRRYRSALGAAEQLLLLTPCDPDVLREAAELASALGDRSRAEELRKRADAARRPPR